MIHTDPLPGDIGLTQIPGSAGAFIRIGQWVNGNGFADYEHAFLVLPDGRLLQAEPGGARMASLEECSGKRTLYAYPAELTDGQRVAICAAAARYLGVPYSFLDYGAIAAHRFRLPIPGLRPYVASTRHMICSQLVDQCYQDAGVHLFDDNRWPGYVTPEALYDLLARGQREQRAAA